MYGIELESIVNKQDIDLDLIGCQECRRIAFNPVMCKQCRQIFCYRCLSEFVLR
jgi:hypothetical protein